MNIYEINIRYHSRSNKQGSLRLEEAMWRPEMRLVRKTRFQGAAWLLLSRLSAQKGTQDRQGENHGALEVGAAIDGVK